MGVGGEGEGGRELIFCAEPASKVISRPSNQPCKQMTEAKKGEREEDDKEEQKQRTKGTENKF